MSDDEREYRRRDKFFTERRGQLRYVVCKLQPFIFNFLSVSLYPINVKIADPIGPKLCMATHMTKKGIGRKLEPTLFRDTL